MKSAPTPSRVLLKNAYETLSWRASIPEPEKLVLWAHWARLDPRLAEILILFFEKNFRKIYPTLLWKKNQVSPLPQALAAAITKKIPKGAPQLFFLREGMPKPERDKMEIERSLRPFLKWGFFGSESPIRSKSPGKATTLSRQARLSILKELSKNRSFFPQKIISKHVEDKCTQEPPSEIFCEKKNNFSRQNKC